MLSKYAILDFDGTVTNAEEEAKTYIPVFKKSIAEQFSLNKFESLWNKAEAEVLCSPDKFGWEYNGKIVAPAAVDPYIRSTVYANVILDDLGLMPDKKERSAFLTGLFNEIYKKEAGVSFREHAQGFLEGLLEKMPVYIVTNSETGKVTEKLGMLDTSFLKKIPVMGNARKYVIDNNWNFPEDFEMPGLNRHVLLKRKSYYDALETILAKIDGNFSDLIVIGDIYELDLALPQHLGVAVCLVANKYTPEYEKNFLQSSKHGFVVNNLMEILQWQ